MSAVAELEFVLLFYQGQVYFYHIYGMLIYYCFVCVINMERRL